MSSGTTAPAGNAGTDAADLQVKVKLSVSSVAVPQYSVESSNAAVTSVLQPKPLPPVWDDEQVRAFIAREASIVEPLQGLHVAQPPTAAVTAEVKPDLASPMSIKERRASFSAMKQQANLRPPLERPVPSLQHFPFEDVLSGAAVQAGLAKAAETQRFLDDVELGRARAILEGLKDVQDLTPDDLSVTPIQTTASPADFCKDFHAVLVLPDAQTEAAALLAAVKERLDDALVAQSRGAQAAPSTGPGGPGKDKGAAGKGQPVQDTTPQKPVEPAALRPVVPTDCSAFPRLLCRDIVVPTAGQTPVAGPRSVPEATSSTGRATSPSTAEKSPAGAAQPPASPGKSRRHKKGSSQALWVPPVVIDPREHRPYDVPPWVQSAMAAFAAAVRVIGTPAGAASLPKGAWLWEAIQPSAVPTRVFDASGAVEPRLFHVRLFWAGAWRRVTVDDQVPVTLNGYPLYITSADSREVWPLVLWKAWWRLVVEDAWSLSLLAPGTPAALSAQAEAQDQALIVHALTGWLPMQLPIQLSPDVDPSKLQALLSGTVPENVPTHGEQLREWAFQSESAAIQWLKQVETAEISRRQAHHDKAIALQEAGIGLLPGEEGVLVGHLKSAEPTTFVAMSEGQGEAEEQRAPVVPLPSLDFLAMSRPILPAPVDAAGSVPAQPLLLMATCWAPGEAALRGQVNAAAQGKAGAAEPHPLPLPVLRESLWASDHLPSEAHAWQAEAGSRLHLVQGDTYMLVMSRDRQVKVRYTVKEGRMSEEHRVQVAASGTEEPLSPRQPPSAAGKAGKGAAVGAPAPPAAAPTMLPPVSAQGPEASLSHETTGVHGEYVEIEEPVVLVLGRKFRAQPSSGVSRSSHPRLHMMPATDHVDQIEQIVAQGFDASVKALMQHAKASGLAFPLTPSPLSSSAHASSTGLIRVPSVLERTLGLSACAVSSQGLQEQSTLLKPLQSVPAALSAAGVERGPGKHDDGEAYPTELLACADLVVTTDPTLPSHPAWRDPTAVEAWIPLSQLGAYFQGPLHMFMNSWANAQVVENVPVVSEDAVAKEAAAAKAKAEAEAAAAAAAVSTGKKGAAAPTLRAAQAPEPAAPSAMDMPAHDGDKTSAAGRLPRMRTVPCLHTINRHWLQAWAGETVQPGVDGSDQPLAVPVKPVQADVVAPVPAPATTEAKSSPVKGKGPGPAAPAAAPAPALEIRAPLTQHLPPGPFVKPLSSTAADQCVYIPRLSSVLGSGGELLSAHGSTGLGTQRIAVMVWRDALDVAAVPYPLSPDAFPRTPVTVTLSKDEGLTALVSKVPTNGTGGLYVAVSQGFVVNTGQAQEHGVLAPGLSTQGQARVSLTLQPPSLHSAQESARPVRRCAVAILEVQHEAADASHATSCGTVYRVSLQGGDTGACCMLLPLPPVRPGYSCGSSERDLPAVVPTTLSLAKVPLVHAPAVSEPLSKPLYALYTPSAATLGHNALFTSPLMSVGPVARVCTAACGVSAHIVQGIAAGLAAGEDLLQAARVQAALTLAARGGSGSGSEADMELIESSAALLASSSSPWSVWHRQSIPLSWLRPPTQTVKVKVKKMVTKKEALAMQGGQEQAGNAANRPPSAMIKGGPSSAAAPASPAPGAPKATGGGPVTPGAAAASTEAEEMVEIEVEEERPGIPDPVEGGIRLYAKLDVLNAHAAPFVRLFTINHKTGHVRAHGGLSTGIIAIDMSSDDGIHAAETASPGTTSASVFARKEGAPSTYVVPPLAQDALPQQTESAPLAVADAPVPVSSADVASRGVSPSVPDVTRLLADARAALLSLTKVHLEEIRSLNRPPDAIADVLSAVLLLLGVQDTSWGSMRIFLARRGVIEDILSYDPGRMSRGTRSQVRKVLKSKAKSFEPDVILRASKAAAPLAAWVKAVMAGQNTAVRGRPLSSSGKRTVRAAAGQGDEDEEGEEEEDEDGMAGMEDSGQADVGSSTARRMVGFTGITADADASLGAAERGVSTRSPDAVPLRDPAVLQEEECVSVVVASCMPSSLAAAGNCGVNPAQLGGPWCLTVAHARAPSRRELATCAAAVAAQQHPVQALLSLPVTACTTVPAEPGTLTRVQVGSGCSVEPPVVFTCTGQGEVATAAVGAAADTHGQDGAVPALPAFLRRAASPAQPLTPVPLFRWMSSLHPTVRPSQIGVRVDLLPGNASPPAGALQKIHVALEVLHASDGRVLGKCSGRGAAELLSLPAAVRGLLPFHPSSAPGPSSKGTGPDGADTTGSPTTGAALKSPTGKDKPAARPDSSSGTKGAAAKAAAADVLPAPTTASGPSSADGEGAPGMKVHPWIARANAEVNWMEAAREHVRAYSRAQENAVLAGAQCIIQATAYVPASLAEEQGLRQIPWRVAISAPALQAPAPVPAPGEVAAAPGKPGTAKVPSRPGTAAAKADVNLPAGTVPTQAGDGSKVQMPAAPFSGLKLQVPAVSDAQFPVKLWQDDRASRLAAGVTVALAECGIRGQAVRSSQGLPAEEAADTKGAKGAKPPAKAASKVAEKPTEEPGARKSVPALPCPLPSVPLVRVELTPAAAACPPVRTDAALAALPYITMADAQAAISAAQPLFESYSKQMAERPASAASTTGAKAAPGAPAKPAPAAAKAGAKAAVGPVTMDTAPKEDPLATLARMPLGSALLRSGTHLPAMCALPPSMAALAADMAEGKQPEGETGAALASSVLKAKADVSLASALSNALGVLRHSVAPGPGQVDGGMWSTLQGDRAGPLVPASLFPASRSLQEISAQWDLSAATPESSARLVEALTCAMTPPSAQSAAAVDACKALASTGIDLSDRDVLAGATRAARRAAASALAQQRVATTAGKGGVVTSAGPHILHALRPLHAEGGKVLAVAALQGSVTRSALGARAASLLASESGRVSVVSTSEGKAAEHIQNALLASHAAAHAPAALADTTAVSTVYGASLHASLRREAVARDVAMYAGLQGQGGPVSAHAGTV